MDNFGKNVYILVKPDRINRKRGCTVFSLLSVNLENRKVVIVGGGEIALRRARFFAKSNPEIIVVAPSVLNSIKEVTSKIYLDSYAPSYLINAFIVVAATNDTLLNFQICADGRRAGALVNNVSDRSDCDIHIPATVQHDIFSIAVSSRGTDIHGAITLRDRIQESLND